MYKRQPAGIAHQNGMWQTLTFTGEKTTGRVVDDWEDPPLSLIHISEPTRPY